MWFSEYGDSFNTRDEAEKDANYTIDWEDYEEHILKNDPNFFENLFHSNDKDMFVETAMENAFGSYFEENYYFDDDIIED